MKVIYKKTMTEQLDKAIEQAHKNRREIERIELMPNEFSQLMRETDGLLKHRIPGQPTHGANRVPGDRYCYFNGVRVQDYEGEG